MGTFYGQAWPKFLPAPAQAELKPTEGADSQGTGGWEAVRSSTSTKDMRKAQSRVSLWGAFSDRTT